MTEYSDEMAAIGKQCNKLHALEKSTALLWPPTQKRTSLPDDDRRRYLEGELVSTRWRPYVTTIKHDFLGASSHQLPRIDPSARVKF